MVYQQRVGETSFTTKPDTDTRTAEFAELINHSSPSSADIQILDPLSWDSHGKYIDVIEAVREASQGNDVRVYQVSRDSTRTEYWVVSHADGKLIGAKALSIES